MPNSRFAEKALPERRNKIDSFRTKTTYQFETDGVAISQLFSEFEAKKQESGVLDWELSQTTLEEVFLSIVGDES